VYKGFLRRALSVEGYLLFKIWKKDSGSNASRAPYNLSAATAARDMIELHPANPLRKPYTLQPV